ncbi:MAG: ATPase, partial [Planctomycetes bacterium]|nr:ATPase [Planctomycetota bacterium]
RSLGSEVPPLGLGDFFLRPDDPLNPDADEPPGSHDADGDGRAERPADDD